MTRTRDGMERGAGYRLKPSAILLCVSLPMLPLFAMVSLFAYWCLLQFASPPWWQSVLYWLALAALYISSTFSVARLFAQRILSGAGIGVDAIPSKDGGA